MNKNFRENYIPRIVDKLLKDQLEASGAVLIEGPKWCGKTTTGGFASKSVIQIDDLENREQYINMSNLNPYRLLEGDVPRLIDEWQLAPNLWNVVRHTVDDRGEPGQFILTGSSVPKTLDTTMHSGTGRIARLRMRTMSLFESNDSTGSVSLKDLFNGAKADGIGKDYSIDYLAYLICRGGWPQAIGKSEKTALLQARNYYDAVVEEDIIRSEDDQKLSPDRAKRILRSYARNVAQQVPLETIRKDAVSNDDESFSVATLYEYLRFLYRIFVLEDSLAWNPNLRSKTAIRTTDTRYFVDPSIGIASLGMGPQDLLNDLNTMGYFFENMCVRDLRVYADALDGQVYHYRDKNGLECDAVIHLRNGKYGLIEIKLGSDDGIKEGIECLTKLSNIIDTSKMKEPSFKMVLIGRGNYAYQLDNGINVVPIHCLKP